MKKLDILGIPRSWLDIPFGVPRLDADGKIQSSQLPDIAISQVFVVASEAAMLALDAQVGDVAKRTDLQPEQSFMLSAEPASTLANWIKISDIAIYFTTLLDTPNSYTGQGGKFVRVKPTVEDGLEFVNTTDTIIYGSEETEDSTTSTLGMVQAFRFSPTLEVAKYLIEISCEIRNNSITRACWMRVELDDTTEIMTSTEDEVPGTTQRYSTQTAIFLLNNTVAGVHNFDFDFQSVGAGTSYIRRKRIALRKVVE